MAKRKYSTRVIIERKKSEDNIDSFFNLNYQIYPPVQDFYDLNEQFDIYNKNNGPKFLNNGIKEEMNSDKEEDVYVINEDFFSSILGKNNYDLDKEKKIKTISKIIRKSKLMAKLEKEFQDSSNKIDLNGLSDMCAKNLSFMELKKGKVLFKIGDKGDRFYFILSGKVAILKPKQITYKMNLYEYLYYLLLLLKEKEDFLFNEVVLNNCALMPIASIEEIKAIYRILFIITLKAHLDNGNIDNNRKLKLFFEKNFQSLHEYNLDIHNLEILEQQKLKSAGNKQWIIYISQNCNLSKSDYRALGRYKGYHEKKNIICYTYETIIYLGPGFFFGDTALEEKVNKRNATIRAEEETVLGFLKSDDYSNMIAPQRKLERMKEINFLINNFFFKNINIPIFEKCFFHLFTLNENSRTILFNADSIPKSLIFLKEGKLSLSLNCSIIDIQNIIKQICNKVIKQFSNELIKKKIITKEKINILKGYKENDLILSNSKIYTKEFIKEINKKRTFQVAVFNGVETVGLEEIYLDIPYITQGIVLSEKIIYYKLSIEKIKSILIENHHINYFYKKSAINKIFSLIERLQTLKQNSIDIAKMRYETPNSFRTKNLPTLKNNKTNQDNNKIELYSTLGQSSSFSKLSKQIDSISRNIGSEIKKKEKELKILSYSYNKSKKLVDTDKNKEKNDIYKNILNYKSPLNKNPYMKNNIFLSILLNKNIGNKRSKDKKGSSILKRNDTNNNTNSKINNKINSKFSEFINSLNKSKNDNFINLKINEKQLKNDEKDSKCSEIINFHKRLASAIPNKSHETIQIGDKFVTLDSLRRKFRNSDCQMYENKKLLQIIQSNNYYLENEKNANIKSLFQKSVNTIPSIETEDNSIIENYFTQKNLIREKSSIIRKSQDIKNFHLSFIPLLSENEVNSKNNKSINTNTNNQDMINKDNYISLLINNRTNRTNDIKRIFNKKLKLQQNKSFNYKNNKKLILHNLLLNKKCLSNQNIFNKNEISKSKNELENDSLTKRHINNIDFPLKSLTPKIERIKLPSIIRKNIDINKSNIKLLNILSQKKLVPEIIKNFYNDKKMKGYVSIIPNKESNTIFLRRYHKKYNINDKNESKNKK